MTIQEAIKSGKPFKRQYDKPDEYFIVGMNNFIIYRNREREFPNPDLTVTDILADDWEVKE